MTKLYRRNVGVIVCRDNKVLLCARADRSDMQWQFPQGGIEKDEDIVEAAKRELFEETGISSVTFRTKMPISLKYDFPKGDKRHCFAPYSGQEQSWVLFDFVGDDSEINFFTNPEEIEFKAFEWVDISEAPKRIVAFKKDVYQKVAEYFSPIIKENNNER